MVKLSWTHKAQPSGRFVFYLGIKVKQNDSFSSWPLRDTLTRQQQIGQSGFDITPLCGLKKKKWNNKKNVYLIPHKTLCYDNVPSPTH